MVMLVVLFLGLGLCCVVMLLCLVSFFYDVVTFDVLGLGADFGGLVAY